PGVRKKEPMRAFGEEIEHGGECLRGERRGRLQCGADIPAMDGEFKETSVSQRVHGDNAHTMIAGFVPILRVEGDEKMMELVPGLTEHGRQVVAKTPSVRDRSLCECHPHCRRSSCECVLKMLGSGAPSGGEVFPCSARVMRSV